MAGNEGQWGRRRHGHDPERLKPAGTPARAGYEWPGMREAMVDEALHDVLRHRPRTAYRGRKTRRRSPVVPRSPTAMPTGIPISTPSGSVSRTMPVTRTGPNAAMAVT